MERELDELALARDVDEAGRLQLLQMVRDGGGADLLHAVQLGAWHRPVAGTDLLEDFIAARLGERAGDALELPLGQARGHADKIARPSWRIPEFQSYKIDSNFVD